MAPLLASDLVATVYMHSDTIGVPDLWSGDTTRLHSNVRIGSEAIRMPSNAGILM